MSQITFDYAQIGGVRLHYAKAGDGDKLVLLLHGFPEFWYSWRHTLEYVSDEYTVVAPDLRGYNLSDKPLRVKDYSLEYLVDDVLGLINYFGREQAAVVGHDWGAIIAWEVARQHPEAVWKLAALQVPPMFVWQKNLTFRQALASWYMFFFQIPQVPEKIFGLNDFAVGIKAMRQAAADPDFFTPAEIAEYKKSWSEPNALFGGINYYRANILPKIVKPPEPFKIEIPTLFIYGEKDSAILPETVRNVGQAVNAPFSEVRIPDSGHWVQQEAAEVVNDSLREFLAEKF
jgi:epoxide hydrolase 4